MCYLDNPTRFNRTATAGPNLASSFTASPKEIYIYKFQYVGRIVVTLQGCCRLPFQGIVGLENLSIDVMKVDSGNHHIFTFATTQLRLVEEIRLTTWDVKNHVNHGIN